MSVFAAAVDALFADPNIATEAVYTPAGGDPTTVRVVARRPEEIAGFGDTRIQTPTALFDVRVSEIAALSPGRRPQAARADPPARSCPLGLWLWPMLTPGTY
ncbi:MAG: hypothetical protein IPM60_16875 [Rhodospirillales bacterium]|nr:hypothetical protein [Rhodospirillales bacterium]